MTELKVTKHNKLVETSYKMGAREQFFVLFLISNLSSHDTEFPKYCLPFSRIMKLMNFDGRRRIANMKDLEKMMDNLNTAPIKFVDGDEDVKVAWITELRYNRKTKDVTFTINPSLKGYLLNLKGFFTNYSIRNVVYLSSHSIRLYELLKRHEYHKEQSIVFKVDQLKSTLGIEDKYPEFYEFKRWVLQSAQEELEMYTDLRFHYSEHEKDGKRVISLKFDIFENEPREHPEALQLLDKFRLNEPDKPYSLAPRGDASGQNPAPAKRSAAAQTESEKLAELSVAQQRAFRFLEEKGVNAKFILDKVLRHPKLKYTELLGFEDLYFQILWQFFKGKTTAQSMAGAFVSWWKNEKFTSDQNHARFLEAVVIRKKKMNEGEREARRTAATASAAEFEKARQAVKTSGPTAAAEPKPARKEQNLREAIAEFSASAQRTLPVPRGFDLAVFKVEQPDVFEKLRERAEQEYRTFYAEMKVAFDAKALTSNIEAKTKGYCEAWWRENRTENEA